MRNRSRKRAYLRMELLESRLAPICTVVRTGAQLLVRCDGVADRVILDHVGTNTIVTHNSTQAPPVADNLITNILIETMGGDDIVDVYATVRTTTVDTGTNRGNTVTVGRMGSTQGVAADVNLRSLGGAAAVRVDDSAGQTPRPNVVFDARSVSGLAPGRVLYVETELTSLTLRGGRVNNRFTVQGTPAVPTTLFAGAGNDMVFVQATAMAGPLTANLEAGNDSVQVGGTSNTLATIRGAVTVRGQPVGTERLVLRDDGTTLRQDYTLSARTLTRAGMGILTYESLDTLELFASRGNDGITVSGTALGTLTILHGGVGNDDILLGTRISSLDNFLGAMRLTGGQGINRVIVTDTASRAANSYAFDTSDFYRIGTPPFSYEGFSFWLMTSGGGDDQLEIWSLDDDTSVLMDFGDGNDLLIGQSIANVWTFTGLGNGNINGNFTFLNLENALGGAAEDRFRFGNGMSGQGVIGAIDGGAGYNTLDYSSFTVGVFVELHNFYAHGSAAAYNFFQVLGGSGDDYIHGDASDNWLVGSDGNDILIGADGADYMVGGTGRDMVFGGSGADWLEAGLGDDLLVGGTTMHDNDVTALTYIWLEWTRTDLAGTPAEQYTQRINNLRNGGGMSTYLLNNTSVFGDGVGDYLYGEGDLDWFWLDEHDVPDRQSNETPN